MTTSVPSPIDPSWLPSTVAQSTAALVAIVGGFLINRLVTLDSEARQSQRRRAEEQARCDAASGERDRRWAEYADFEAVTWLQDRATVEQVIRSVMEHDDGEASFEDITAELPEDLSPTDVGPALQRASAVVLDFSRLALEQLPESEKQPTWSEFSSGQRLPADGFERYRRSVFGHISRQKSQEARKRREERERQERQTLPGLVSSSVLEGLTGRGLGNIALARNAGLLSDVDLELAGTWRSTESGRLYRAWDAASRDFDRAAAELRLAEQAVVVAAPTPWVPITLAVLTFFAFVGIVLPVVALWNEHTSAAPMRAAVGVGFIVGAVVFVAFMWGYAWSLGQLANLRISRRRSRNSG